MIEGPAFLQWLRDDCGYLSPRPLPNDRYAVILPLMFTHAIIAGRIGDRSGYDDRWCYENRAAAEVALAAWDGTGEPAGWHRHPASGRRHYVRDGVEVFEVAP